VEKIAVALWKQRRMVAAETASIELSRRSERPSIREAIGKALGRYRIEASELEAVDPELLEGCEAVLAEFNALDQAVLTDNNLEALAKKAPLMFDQYKDEADVEELTLEAWLAYQDDGLTGWANDLVKWCDSQIKDLSTRPIVQAVAELVQVQACAPVANELMVRYQVAMDGELYRAMDALRKQQEWRLKMVVDVAA